MVENVAVPLVVVSKARDPVEALNSLLRRHGLPAHCTWIPAVTDLPDALAQLNPDLLICVTRDGTELPLIAKVRDVAAVDLPLLVIRSEVSEPVIAADQAAGARDSMSLTHPERVHAVLMRELNATRLRRALDETMLSAKEYRKQLETVLTRSNDAIAQIKEGILVDANQAWLDLIGAPDVEAVVGQPIMDCFDEANHTALKGALAACLQGRWNDHSLRADLVTADGGSLPVELVLALGESDGEAGVRLMVPSQKRDDEHVGRDLAEAVRRNPRTGLLYRQPLLEAMHKRAATPVHGGGRFTVLLRPDRFATLEKELGALHSEEFIAALAALLRSHLAPTDLAGQFSGAGMMILLERGTPRDAEVWAERLLEKIVRHEFELCNRRFKVSVTIGVAEVSHSDGKLDAAIAAAQDAVRRGRQRGGNQVSAATPTDTDARVQAYDAVWVKHIRAALAENRFRLVQQPIASLAGGAESMFDMLVRMLDRQGKEILPSEFMPAAERNELIGAIDRWVFVAAARFAARSKPGCLFVRLSRASVLDAALPEWIATQLGSLNVEPRRLCIQVTENLASRHPTEISRLAKGLRAAGLRFALEHFGAGIDPLGLLSSLPIDFVKIDGSLMQGLTDDTLLQSKVSNLVDASRDKDIETIAERVEDANTMAVLWQLGVQHLQGFLIQAPEEVVMSAAETAPAAAQTGQSNASRRSTLR